VTGLRQGKPEALPVRRKMAVTGVACRGPCQYLPPNVAAGIFFCHRQVFLIRSRWIMRSRLAILLSFPLLFCCLADGTAARLDEATPASSWVKRSWTTDEGLPDNTLTGVVQTDDGFIWVATLGGLIQFDGVRFKEASILHLPGVANRVVRSVHLDRGKSSRGFTVRKTGWRMRASMTLPRMRRARSG
jgi:hypothetical protein